MVVEMLLNVVFNEGGGSSFSNSDDLLIYLELLLISFVISMFSVPRFRAEMLIDLEAWGMSNGPLIAIPAIQIQDRFQYSSQCSLGYFCGIRTSYYYHISMFYVLVNSWNS
uniref:Uncharacterized protein n=1 Tax=Spongospora subterranea TaxID=70186 RepID=A0A0H5QXN5_9EUKA|eukprot:CRZ06501.1 hypothetical protein [Spongospora subterranea]